MIDEKNKLQEKVQDWLDNLLYEDLTDNTLRSYRAAIACFTDFISESGYDIIDHDVTLKYKKYLDQRIETNTMKESTANHRILVLNKFLNSIGLADCKIKQFRVQRKQFGENALTIDECHQLEDAALALGDENIALIIETFVKTGIRLGELKYITVETLQSKKAHVRNKGKYRYVFLPDSLVESLKDYCSKKHIEHGIIFHAVRNKDKPITTTSLVRKMKKAARFAEIDEKKVHPHSLRHTYAKHLLNKGASLTAVRDLLGHEDIKTTALYLRNSEKELTDLVNTIKFY